MSGAPESLLDPGLCIAVIGMAGRFAGARDLPAFWTNLRGGVESVRIFTDEELLAAGESLEALGDAAYVRARPALADIEMYDAAFFGHSARDAAIMDPQHRLFFETAWEALESAGYAGGAHAGSVGVFASAGPSAYMMHHLLPNREVMDTAGEWLVRHTANDPSFLATRVSYELNLTGPSLSVQTACSSALVAVHLAVQSLLSGECDTALAGASAIALPQDRGYFYKEGGILSPDGRCRAFDAHARGTAMGGGVGCVVLKRLADALADGDHVLAVIRGSAINNDGSAKLGYLAPSVEGQAKVITEALAVAHVGAETVSYVETHGSGTLLGDAIEVAALTRAYRATTGRKGTCAIGSAKPNIGHLGEAAGIAGFIKAVLALSHGELPPSLNYEAPNPEIDFPSTPFYVNARLQAWSAEGGPRRAGVTALGVGGTNAHVILEEAPPIEASRPSHAPQLLVLSAKTETALDAAAKNLARHLRDHPEQALADVAYTLQLGRKAFAHRRAVMCRDREDAIRALETGGHEDLGTLGDMWVRGADVDWKPFHEGQRRRRVPLPTYPFERSQFWIERPVRLAERGGSGVVPALPRSRRAAPHVAPRDEIERELAELWHELLGVQQVGVDDDFFEVGGQSLLAVRLFDAIRHRWGLDLPLSTLFEAPTIARCAALLRAELGLELDETAPPPSGRVMKTARALPSRWSSLVAMQPEGTRPPFYCVAGMGGNLVNLRHLALLIGDDQPFYGLQPPGLDGREERLYQVEALASHYVQEILAHHPEGPFLLGGYSGGGIAAFEMACQLARQGREVAFVGLIDSFSPALPERSLGARLRIHAHRTLDGGSSYLADLAGRRLAYERTEALRLVARWLGGVFPERYRYDNIADAWLTAERAYAPGMFEGTTTLFRAVEESATSLWTAFDVDEQHGWGRFVRGGVEVVTCPGDHTTLCEEPHVRVLAAKLRAALDRALAAPQRVSA